MRQKVCGIYKISNKETGKAYVGQSIDIYRRWVKHRKKYPDDKFNYEILMECDRIQLDFWEIAWVISEKSFVPNGYNRTIGGQKSGWACDESRKLMSESAKRRAPRTPEHCANIAKSLKGKTFSEEHRLNVSLGNKKTGRMKNMNNLQSTCPKCGKQGQLNALKRWHFDNCREVSHSSP